MTARSNRSWKRGLLMRVRRLVSLGILGAVLLAGACSQSTTRYEAGRQGNAGAPQQDLTLTVGLYPYVPNLTQFQTVITTAWDELDTGVDLDFVKYDCYSNDPPPSLEVFVFDGIFLSYFATATSNYLRPFSTWEISNFDDYLPYAIEGAQYGGEYYALPQIGCTNILFYRSGDEKMSDVNTLGDLWTALGPATYTWPEPPQGTGFMMDFSGGTTDACTYIAAYESYYNSYTTTPPTPSASNLDQNVLANLSLMVQMAGPAQAAWVVPFDDPYQRAQWFDSGAAEAMVGFTESMSNMPDHLSTTRFKEMPLGGNPDFSLFFVDVVGVNSNVVGTTLEDYAVQLANLMTSTAVIVDTFSTGAPSGAQYLMPVRSSVFVQLGAVFPQYQAMYDLVLSLNPKFFRLGPTSRNWLNMNKDGIRQVILSLSAGDAPVNTGRAPKD